jgi:hypothetical protein
VNAEYTTTTLHASPLNLAMTAYRQTSTELAKPLDLTMAADRLPSQSLQSSFNL